MLDLIELYAKTANLDLMIEAAQVFNRAIRTVTGQIPGAVQPSPRRTKGVREEGRGCQVRPMEVTARKPTPPM